MHSGVLQRSQVWVSYVRWGNKTLSREANYSWSYRGYEEGLHHYTLRRPYRRIMVGQLFGLSFEKTVERWMEKLKRLCRRMGIPEPTSWDPFFADELKFGDGIFLLRMSSIVMACPFGWFEIEPPDPVADLHLIAKWASKDGGLMVCLSGFARPWLGR